MAHAADIAQAATATALVRRLDTDAGRDIFHDPFADDAVTEAAPPRLVLIGTAEEDPLHISADPEGQLGPERADRWDETLPFLLKVLAADQPLSLQAHPSLAQARAGFAAEEAAGCRAKRPTATTATPTTSRS